MIRAVLFDLDGTLLDIELDTFLSSYFSALGPVLASVTGLPQRTALAALSQATDAMMRPHAGVTNRDVFNQAFETLTGTDLSLADHDSAVREFYDTEFPRLKGTHGPRRGADAAVAAARSAGMHLALATNPIFPRAAILERLRWTGIDAAEFDVVTTYEVAEACKPLPAYFLSVAAALGTDPAECLMVGDDPNLDMRAADTGMKTFYVGASDAVDADWQGSLLDLSDVLARLPG